MKEDQSSGSGLAASSHEGVPTFSVCIATYQRPTWLGKCLESLAHQTHEPDEVVISDGGGDTAARQVIQAFRERYPALTVLHRPTDRKALPWQRRWAFLGSSGSVVLFLDDDVELAPRAVELVINCYQTGGRNGPVSGVGCRQSFKTKPSARRQLGIRWRWLGLWGAVPGSVLPGGEPVPWTGFASQGESVAVQWLWGGAMSFRREVLELMGPMEHLYGLYDQRVGRGEDGVLSHEASRHGVLLALTGDLAFHPTPAQAESTAFAQGGWRKGILETWGKAHSLRWMASDTGAVRLSWWRRATLELANASLRIAIRPWRLEGFACVAGCLYGMAKTILLWRRIPDTPSRSA